MKLKRKWKFFGLAALLSFFGFGVVESASSGGVGFGIAVLVCYFLSCLCLFFLCVLSVKIYRKVCFFVDDMTGVGINDSKRGSDDAG